MEIMIESKKALPHGEIGRRGEEIYAAIKNQYEPQYNGKILAIDIETGKTYMADDVRGALQLLEAERPDDLCYVMRIGFDFVYQM